jgi:hypothetical protein
VVAVSFIYFVFSFRAIHYYNIHIRLLGIFLSWV